MYPALLMEREFPIALCGVRARMGLAELSDLAYQFGVIADVTIETEHGEYPYRRGERVLYPVGKFRTVLAGPDIMSALRDSKISRVWGACTYRMGRPFKEAMSALLAERASAQARGDVDGEAFAKLLSNSLAGKLAQHAGKWVRRAHMDNPGTWGERYIISRQTAKPRRIRFICGAAFEYLPDEFGAGPHTSAFAYLTAYGRVQMRRYRDLCPPKTVVSQDTDGIWVLPDGIEALRQAKQLDDARPGRLRIKDTARTWEFWGPKHYVVDGRWTLAGLCWDSVDQETREVAYTSTTPLFMQRCHGAPSEVVTQLHKSIVKRDLGGGRVQPDGWILPPRILATWAEERDSGSVSS